MKNKFPDGFFWGTATASYQIEGAIDKDGKSKSIWDTFTHTPGKIKNNENGDIAVDHYHRYEEDIELMANINLNSYRFSLAWTRIIPDGIGKINNEGINPQKVGDLPMHLANLMKTNINVQQLTIEALRTKKKDAIYHAAMLDPLTSSLLSLDQISSMVDELLIAHKNWIPKFN